MDGHNVGPEGTQPSALSPKPSVGRDVISPFRPNRGWFFAVAAVLAPYILDRLDAPLWIVFSALGVSLAVALLWPMATLTLKRQLSLCAFLLLYCVCVTGVMISRDNPSDQRVSLLPALIIDSVRPDGTIDFHLNVENISSLDIENIRFEWLTNGASYTSFDPTYPRDLPAGGRMDIGGFPFSDIEASRRLTAIFAFTSLIDNNKTQFESRHRFAIPEHVEAPRTIYPYSYEELAGVLNDEKARRTAMDGLARPEGTIAFWARERVRLSNSQRCLLVEPAIRRATFSSIGLKEPKTLVVDFEPRDDGQYFAAITWDEHGDMSLHINGHSVTSGGAR